jgi:hypothetical protein
VPLVGRHEELAPGRVDAHWNQFHRADRTGSRLVFEHLGVSRHRTDVGHRRKLLLSGVDMPRRLWRARTEKSGHDQNRQSHALQMHTSFYRSSAPGWQVTGALVI